MNTAIAPSPALCESTDEGLGGLIARIHGREQAFPLRDVKVRARIAGMACRTTVEQRFANPFDQPLEAVHIFPLPESAAIVAMELRAGEMVVRADLRERKEAEKVFSEARDRGHRAALLTHERADVHTLSVTNIPAGAEITVRIELIERLDAIDGRLRWRFPTTIAPRYTPGNARGHAGKGVMSDTDHAPDASRLSPPIRLEGGTRLDLEVEIEGSVKSLESSLHALRVGFEGGVRVAPSGSATCDRDFVLALAMSDGGARAFRNGEHTLIIVEPPATGGTALPRDALFMVDISGSMSGTKLTAAKKALTAALHGLMPGDRFRLMAFDDHVEAMTPDFVAYDDRSLVAGDRWIAKLKDRGGTEMLGAIQAALAGETPAGRIRTVLFITDGQAHNDAELIAAVAARRGAARLFTLGIDTAVNASLLKSLARVGGGACELATPADDIEAVIARVEARFGAPLAEAVTVDVGEVARMESEALFSGRPVALLVRGEPTKVTAGSMSYAVSPVPTDLPLATLWARDRIASLDDRIALRPWEEEAIRGEILRLALAAKLSSRCTAWVAVETTVTVAGERIEVVQPVELPDGWSEDFRSGGTVTGSFSPMAGAPVPSAPPPMLMSSMPSRARRVRALAPPEDDEVDAFMAPPPAKSVLNAVRESVTHFFHRPSPQTLADVDTSGVTLGLTAAGDPAGELARTQSADGSFAGDVARTAAALLALVLLGHTRQTGTRRRTVMKAAAWLASRAGDPLAAAALAALEEAERGDAPVQVPEWAELRRAIPEGACVP